MSAFNAHVIDVAHSTKFSICLRGAVMTLILIKSEAFLALQTSLSFGIRFIFPTVPAATHTLLALTVNRAEIVPRLTNFALMLPIAIILAKGAALLAFLAQLILARQKVPLITIDALDRALLRILIRTLQAACLRTREAILSLRLVVPLDALRAPPRTLAIILTLLAAIVTILALSRLLRQEECLAILKF